MPSPLAPVAGPDPRVLVLGSFPSRLSLAHAEYYGNSRNQFWQIMAAVAGIDAAAPYRDRIGQLEARGIALWDVVRSCSRPGSADARISGAVTNDIAGFVAKRPSLRLIALNGSTAARLYRRIGAQIPVPSVVLPSTSPAYAAMTPGEKIRRWSALMQE
jgi:TDG/mug DNA glycosylase family protein